MKRLAFWLAVGMLTFAFGVAAVWILVRLYQLRSPRPLGTHVGTPRGIGHKIEPPVTKLEKFSDLPEPMKEHTYASIQFVNTRVGWLTLNNGLWRTRDGGEEWDRVFSGEYGDDPFIQLGRTQFINANEGWMVASFNLYKTEDGGDTWRVVPQPIPFSTGSHAPAGIYDVSMLKDGNHGWILGNHYRRLSSEDLGGVGCPPRFCDYEGKRLDSSLVYFTSNGGRSWTREELPYQWLETIDALYAFDAEHAWAAGQAGTFYRHGGKWHPTAANRINSEEVPDGHCLDHYYGAPTDQPSGFFFVNARTGWIANTNGYLGSSTDGGRTWTDLSDELGGVGQSGGLWQSTMGMEMYFSNAKEGWGIDGNRFLRKTGDGGATWQLVDDTMPLNDMFFLDPNHGFLVSEDGIFRIPTENPNE
jgi:photosystem II stability/assembly factor-like uncharacterized protein